MMADFPDEPLSSIVPPAATPLVRPRRHPKKQPVHEDQTEQNKKRRKPSDDSDHIVDEYA